MAGQTRYESLATTPVRRLCGRARQSGRVAADTPLTSASPDVSTRTDSLASALFLGWVRTIEGTLIGPSRRTARTCSDRPTMEKPLLHRGFTGASVVRKGRRTGVFGHAFAPTRNATHQKIERATTISLALRVRVARLSASDRASEGREFTSRRVCDAHSIRPDRQTKLLRTKLRRSASLRAQADGKERRVDSGERIQ